MSASSHDVGAETSGSKRKLSAAWPVIAIVLLLALTWWAAFSVTGILWWHAQEDAADKLPPPRPLELGPTEPAWVNLELYHASHPQWRP